MRETGRDPLTALAHHVAGHVVMSFAVDCPAASAGIDGPDDDPGYALPGGGRKLTIRRRFLIALAGHQAEMLHLGEAFGLYADTANERLAFDMLHVMREFEAMGLRGAGASSRLRGQLGAVLRDLFSRAAVWDRVRDVAEALAARRRLTASELRALIPAEVTVLGTRLLDETRRTDDPAAVAPSLACP
ncbi:MAG: hypothetical protein RDU30_10795 [Desulfovibrionaceae bacterium]|nr:hypothetical protein [Desulfovibrionaceae bacterium]